MLLAALTYPLASVDAADRRQGRRHERKEPVKDKCQDPMSEQKLMADYRKQVSLNQGLGLHESFYQMAALRGAFLDEDFEVFKNESRGLVQIERAPLDSKNHET